MKRKFTKSNGFTIVEVMIVLAIAGLIISIVFLAVPQLQRNQRDAQRKTLTARLKGEIETYASNNQGVYPFAGVTSNPQNCSSQSAATYNCNDWFTKYISGGKINIADPSGNNVNIYYDNTIALPTVTGTWIPGDVYIIVGGYCSGSGVAGNPGNASSKAYATEVALERSNIWYCIDNR